MKRFIICDIFSQSLSHIRGFTETDFGEKAALSFNLRVDSQRDTQNGVITNPHSMLKLTVKNLVQKGSFSEAAITPKRV